MGLALSALQTSERLEINSNTLRSHSIFLEGKGYRFIISSQNTPPSRNVVSREGMNANPIILPVLIC